MLKVAASVNEIKLLADINENHCDCQYGGTFSNECLVKDEDVVQYRHYLTFCCNKLFSQGKL